MLYKNALTEIPSRSEFMVLINIAMKIHRHLGKNLNAGLYKQAFEAELADKGISFVANKQYDVSYNGVILNYKFHVDFLVENDVLVIVKSSKQTLDIIETSVYQKLVTPKPKTVLIINFYEDLLQFKKIIINE
ncbi:GxxExxY protein [Pedobacter aquatilis]|nr:GxxExxY protein [Pedobacter aquatilis]